MANRFCLTTKEFCADYPYSESTLLRLRADGTLVPGHHFILKSAGKSRPSLLWDPVAVEEVLIKRSRKTFRR